MSPEAIEKELRRVLSLSSLEVRRERRTALEHRAHPDSLLVFDRSPRTGAPYFVAAIQRHGVPKDDLWPGFVQGLWDKLAPNSDRRRRGWAQKMAFDARDADRHGYETPWKRFREALRAQREEMLQKLSFDLGERRVFNYNGERLRKIAALTGR